MLGIMKKDAVIVFSYSLIMTAGLGFYLVSVGRPLDPAIIGLSCLYLLLAVSGSITISEQKEYKSNGYMFLKSLPVTDMDILGSKFLLSALNLFVSFGILLVSTSRIPSDPFLYKVLVVSLMTSMIIAWIMSGLWYWGIYALGISTMVKVVWGCFVAIIICGLGFIEFGIYRKMLDISVPGHFIMNLNWKMWVVLFLCALSLYVQMFRLSLNAVRRKAS